MLEFAELEARHALPELEAMQVHFTKQVRDGEAQGSLKLKKRTGQARDTTCRPANEATAAAGSLPWTVTKESDSDDNPASTTA